jgi:endonuclease VIII
MPEGDTIFRAARALHAALAGRVVTRFETVLPALARVDVDTPIAGRTVLAVEARGKHLLMRFSARAGPGAPEAAGEGGLVLRTHMRMSGSWHLYRPGARWRLPRAAMRIVVETAEAVAVGFDVPIAEWLAGAAAEARHEDLAALGPDLLAAGFDAAEAAVRLRARAGVEIGDALLDQRALAGIGNELKSEILFVARVHPAAPVAALDDAALARIVEVARKLLRMNVGPGGPRRTTGSLDPRATLWVFGRSGKACRRCGAAIRYFRQGPHARGTYFCPACQPPSAPGRPPAHLA